MSISSSEPLPASLLKWKVHFTCCTHYNFRPDPDPTAAPNPEEIHIPETCPAAEEEETSQGKETIPETQEIAATGPFIAQADTEEAAEEVAR